MIMPGVGKLGGVDCFVQLLVLHLLLELCLFELDPQKQPHLDQIEFGILRNGSSSLFIAETDRV